MDADFTVLLSSYNGADYIVPQLESILSQTLKPKHILVRDDGSRDATPKILEGYAARGQIELTLGENVGFLESFRRLLAAAPESGFFAFSDQDDIWLPDKLSRAAAYLTAGDNSLPRLHHGAYRMVAEDLSPLRDFLPGNPPFSFRRSLAENVCSGFALAGNAALRERMLQFDWSKLDYHDWLCGAVALGLGEACFDGRVTALHRRLKKSVTVDSAAKGWRWALHAMRGDTNMKIRNQEFYRCYGAALHGEALEAAKRFNRFDLRARFQKALYPKRWRYGWPDEIAVRLAMLRGTL